MSEKKQSHYSPEEMIRAAQARKPSSRPSQAKVSREVVTQDDGTKIVRVRRKRRKSSSTDDLMHSGKEEKRLYLRLFWISTLTLFLVAITLTGLFFFKCAFYNSPTHVAELEKAISQASKANTKISGYKFGATSSLMSQFETSSKIPNGPYFKLNARDVEIPHRPESVLFGSLRGEPASIQSANFIIDYEHDGEVYQADGETAPSDPLYSHDSLAINALNIAFKSDDPKNASGIRNLSAKLFRNPSKQTQILLKSGSLHNISGLPQYLDTASCLQNGQTLIFNPIKLTNNSFGSFEIRGNYSLKTNKPQKLQCIFSDLSLEGISASLDALIEARISSTNGTIMIDPLLKGFKATARVTPTSSGISLKNFRFLDTIGGKFGDLNYPYVSFRDQVEANLTLTKTSLLLSNLELEKEGFLAIKGAIEIAHKTGDIKGKLKVGLPTLKLAQAYPNANQERWNVQKGYVWFNISLSGNAKEPNDNFEDVFVDLVEL